MFNDGTLVGFVWCYIHDYFGEKRLHVNQIVIDKDFRGQGIAKKLLAQTEKYADKLNIKTIDLFVTEGNITAVKMYEDLGYVTERRYLKRIYRRHQMLEIINIDESEKWDSIVKSFSNYDVYYMSGYTKAFKLHGDGEPTLIYYHDEKFVPLMLL